MDSDPPKSDPPVVKLALVGQHTVITVSCVMGVVFLALHQQWPVNTTLMALGGLSGIWAVGRVMNGKK